MALNANNVQSNKSNYETMEAGTYPTRLVHAIDLGLQAQRPFKGEDKAPAREIALTYEFVDVFMLDEDGNYDEAKPRHLTEMIPFHNLKAEKSKSTQRYHAFDPSEVNAGDWVAQLGKAVNATVVLNPSKGRTYENIAALSQMRAKDSEKCPQLVNDTIAFDLDTPDPAVWARIPKFIQDRIKANLEFEGSALQKLIGKDTTPTKEPEKKQAVKPKVAPKAKPVADTDPDDLPY